MHCCSNLQGSVWKELHICPDVHNAVFAWVHYRQVRLFCLQACYI